MSHRWTLAAAAALALLAAPARAQQVTPDAAAMADQIGRAEIAYLTPEVRAEVERRATGGNTLRGVIGVMLLNSGAQVAARMGGLTGTPQVIAWDFPTGHLIVRCGDRLVLMPFNQATLEVRRPS